MFVNGVLYNGEVWQGLRATDLTLLENIDHQLMSIICDGHSKTPVEFYYLETATQPLKSIVASRRILYLHHILSRNNEELIRRVFNAQKDNTTPGDFLELVKGDLANIGETFDEKSIGSQTKTQYKNYIRKKMKLKAFEDLKTMQAGHSKIRGIKYDKFTIQEYMTSPTFTNEMVSLLFNMRCSMTRGVKCNFSSIFRGDLGCKLKCDIPEALDSQEHLNSCPRILSKMQGDQHLSFKYADIFGSLGEQRQAVEVLARILEIRDQILGESLPVGQNTGPNSTVTPPVNVVFVK